MKNGLGDKEEKKKKVKKESSKDRDRDRDRERDRSKEKSKKESKDESKIKKEPKKLQVEFPQDVKQRKVIDVLAKFVAKNGAQFERRIIEEEEEKFHKNHYREGVRPFAFLMDWSSPEYKYYLWRTWSLGQGDTLEKWRMKPFQIWKNGPYLQPPTSGPDEDAEGKFEQELEARHNKLLPEHYRRGRSHGRDDRDLSYRKLEPKDRDHLKDMLEGLNLSRQSICDVMMFCLDNAKYADDCTHLVCRDLLEGRPSPEPIKAVGLFFVVNDLLHNASSTASGAWSYRSKIEKILPEMAEGIGSVAEEACIKEREKIKDAVVAVFDSWNKAVLFNNTFIQGLESAALRTDDGWQKYNAKQSLDMYLPRVAARIRDWQQQHFSSLEKLCRMRGLRSSTEHIGTNADERAAWLIERLLNYELYLIDRGLATSEPQPVLTFGKSLIRKEEKKSDQDEDIDGEEIEADPELDGDDLSGSDLDDLSSLPSRTSSKKKKKKQKARSQDKKAGKTSNSTRRRPDEFVDGTPLGDIDGEELDGEALDPSAVARAGEMIQLSPEEVMAASGSKNGSVVTPQGKSETSKTGDDDESFKSATSEGGKSDYDDDIDGAPLELDPLKLKSNTTTSDAPSPTPAAKPVAFKLQMKKPEPPKPKQKEEDIPTVSSQTMKKVHIDIQGGQGNLAYGYGASKPVKGRKRRRSRSSRRSRSRSRDRRRRDRSRSRDRRKRSRSRDRDRRRRKRRSSSSSSTSRSRSRDRRRKPSPVVRHGSILNADI